MRALWRVKNLNKIAEIRTSNVDKKTKDSERHVLLCNYMDVYSHEYIVDNMPFMEATATRDEIERFHLQEGDVIITKDSESPDDIGVPAVVLRVVDNLVCGYHLSLIRPYTEEVNSVYLSKQLSTHQVQRYFAQHATGSTRFGLSIATIENVEIPLPPPLVQAKIAEILSLVDEAIRQTESIIAKHERIKTGLMQDLLQYGIDEDDNIRSEETHEFKDSPLGRIPVEWEVTKLGAVASLQRGHDITENETVEGVYPVVSSGGVLRYHNQFTTNAPNVVVGRKGTIGKVHYLDVDFWAHDTTLYVTNFFGNEALFVYYLFTYLHLEKYGTRSGSPSLNRNDIHPLWLGVPSVGEQKRISSLLQRVDDGLFRTQSHLQKLTLLKSGLMQDLLTGNKSVEILLPSPSGEDD